MSKILITGSTGMVGRNVVNLLSKYDWDLLTPSRVQLNLENFSNTLEYFKKEKPQIVIHCAGLVGGIKANLSRPIEFLIKNVDINKNLIMSSAQMDVKKLINLGSSCIYPKNAPNPLKEDQIMTGQLEPSNEGYAIAKIMAIKLCDFINKEYSTINYKTMIPCNLFGEYDNFDPNSSHLIAAVIYKIHSAIKQNSKYVEIWGDGKAKREFMYAGDLADAILFAIDNFEAMPNIINIGTGKDMSINKYYSLVGDVLKFNGDFIHNLEMPVGMKRKLVSIDKQSTWGWSPKTDFKEAIESTYKYYKERIVI